MRLAILAVATLLTTTAAGAADEDASFPFGERDFPVEEIAADMAYGFCPLYLAEQFPLTGNFELQQRGFGEDIRRTPDARFGELEQVTAVRPDGNVAFGGVAGKVCSVTLTGVDFDAVLDRLRSDMAFMGLAFEPDPANTGDRGFAKLASFKAPVGEQVLHVQLARVSNPAPAVVAQLFVTNP